MADEDQPIAIVALLAWLNGGASCRVVMGRGWAGVAHIGRQV